MNLTQELRQMGGITQTRLLRERGHSDYAVRQAIARGELQRPRRGWIALANSPPELLAAARHGLVVSCVSRARELQLWVPHTPEAHYAVQHRGLHADPSPGTVHWRLPLVLRAPDALRDSIENTLNYVAHCQPHDTALAIWESAFRKGLVDLPGLRGLELHGAARQLLDECTPFADSGLETMFRTRMGWLRIPITPQVRLYGHRVDFLIGERLVVQIDGGTHVGPQRTRDIRHDALLMRHGYRVLRFGYAQVIHEWHEVQRTILQAIARGHHTAR